MVFGWVWFDAPFFRDSALNRHGKFPIRLNQQLDIIPLDLEQINKSQAIPENLKC